MATPNSTHHAEGFMKLESRQAPPVNRELMIEFLVWYRKETNQGCCGNIAEVFLAESYVQTFLDKKDPVNHPPF